MGYGVRFPTGQKIFLYLTAFRPALGPAPMQWVPRALAWGIKQPGHEADHLPLSSAEVKNGGAISPLPHTLSLRDA
jgi:hypothetical protein